MFQMPELTEVIRQKGDTVFIYLLNKVGIGNDVDDNDVETILKAKFISQGTPNYPPDAIYTWAKNSPVQLPNAQMLDRISDNLYTVYALDIFPKNV